VIRDALFAACVAAASPDSVDLLALQRAPAGLWMPVEWTTKAVRGHRAPAATVLDAPDGRFLRVEGADRAAFFVRQFPEPVASDGSRLTISWRIPLAPSGADMRDERTDDSPMRIFVVFQTPRGFRSPPRTLFYSSGRAERAAFSRSSARSDNLHVLRITDSGNDSAWTTISVQPAVDYARVWPGAVPCVLAIGVMQDTDATHARAIADLRQLFWRSHAVTIR
jgi:Protein of unknown function (DUF3047)